MYNNMYKIVNKPKNISLWELVKYNYISENDINNDGKVSETIYQHAVNNYISEMGINRNRNISVIHKKSNNTNNNDNNIINSTSINTNNTNTNTNKEIEEKETCCICLRKKTSHIFIPCYHLCCCYNCSLKVNKCPKCRVNIIEKHKVYF